MTHDNQPFLLADPNAPIAVTLDAAIWRCVHEAAMGYRRYLTNRGENGDYRRASSSSRVLAHLNQLVGNVGLRLSRFDDNASCVVMTFTALTLKHALAAVKFSGHAALHQSEMTPAFLTQLRAASAAIGAAIDAPPHKRFL